MFDTIKELIEFTEQVPDNKFTQWSFEDADGRMCIQGHMNVAMGLPSNTPYPKGDNNAYKVLVRLLGPRGAERVVSANNNGLDSQESKEKVLSALNKYYNDEYNDRQYLQ